jgi:hypothetical protein
VKKALPFFATLCMFSVWFLAMHGITSFADSYKAGTIDARWGGRCAFDTKALARTDMVRNSDGTVTCSITFRPENKQ